MKNVFISQPMRGKTGEEIRAERERAVEAVKALVNDEVKIMDSYFDDFDVDGNQLEYLAKSIALLAKADVTYFAKGWKDARGCRIEHICAVEYAIDRIEG